MFALCFAVCSTLWAPASAAGGTSVRHLDTGAVAPRPATSAASGGAAQTSRRRRRHVSQPAAPERLFYSQTSMYDMTEESVFRDRASWDAAWAQLNNGMVAPDLPAVDFTTSSVVLVAIGQRRSAGSEVRVGAIERRGADAVVHYTVTEPAPGCVTAQMLTSPVVAVRVPRIAGAVRFERETVRRPC